MYLKVLTFYCFVSTNLTFSVQFSSNLTPLSLSKRFSRNQGHPLAHHWTTSLHFLTLPVSSFSKVLLSLFSVFLKQTTKISLFISLMAGFSLWVSCFFCFWTDTEAKDFVISCIFWITLRWNPRTFITMAMMPMATSVMGLRAVAVALRVPLTPRRVTLLLSVDGSYGRSPIIISRCGNYLSVASLSGLALDIWCFFLCFISLVWSCALALSLLSSASPLPLARSIVAI